MQKSLKGIFFKMEEKNWQKCWKMRSIDIPIHYHTQKSKFSPKTTAKFSLSLCCMWSCVSKWAKNSKKEMYWVEKTERKTFLITHENNFHFLFHSATFNPLLPLTLYPLLILSIFFLHLFLFWTLWNMKKALKINNDSRWREICAPLWI